MNFRRSNGKPPRKTPNQTTADDGGMLPGQKISDRVAEMRTLLKGIDQRSACRHPDWTGSDNLEIKLQELREITNWQKPVFIKVGGTRPHYDVAPCVKAAAMAQVPLAGTN